MAEGADLVLPEPENPYKSRILPMFDIDLLLLRGAILITKKGFFLLGANFYAKNSAKKLPSDLR